MRPIVLTLVLMGCTGDKDAEPTSSDEPATTDTAPPVDTDTTDTDTTDTDTDTTDTETVDSAPTAETADSGLLLPMAPGTYPQQAFDHDGEPRFYLLHVPASYDGSPMPMLVDLHGTAGAIPPPEEAYGLDGAIDTSEAEGFLLLRPRSRSSDYGNGEVFRWDQNPGDPELNTDFVLELVEELATTVAIDQDHLHVMGFSSGTNQTAMLAEVSNTPFDGFGHIGGGAWWTSQQPVEARVYLATPYRDYMRRYHHILLSQLDAHAHPPANRLHRPSMSGHEIYDDMYSELWAWLDRGEVTPDGSGPSPGWTSSSAPGALAAHKEAGDIWLAGADVLGRWDGSSFSPSTIVGQPFDGPGELTGLCLTGSIGAAVGNGAVLWTNDGGASFTHIDPLPEPGPAMFGYTHWNGVGCHEGTVMGVGYWSAGQTTDGIIWTDVALDPGGYRAQAQSATADADGTWVTTGYYRFLAVDTVTKPYTALGQASWVLDSAVAGPDTWVAVGDHGTVLRSTDGAATWSAIPSSIPDTGELNAVAFRDDGVGLVVGRAGAAWLSSDAGATWSDVGLGLNRLLADVVWQDDGTALVVGPDGSWVFQL